MSWSTPRAVPRKRLILAEVPFPLGKIMLGEASFHPLWRITYGDIAFLDRRSQG
jgi:hypothetical protein